jgi:hypothetical protein
LETQQSCRRTPIAAGSPLGGGPTRDSQRSNFVHPPSESCGLGRDWGCRYWEDQAAGGLTPGPVQVVGVRAHRVRARSRRPGAGRPILSRFRSGPARGFPGTRSDGPNTSHGLSHVFTSDVYSDSAGPNSRQIDMKKSKAGVPGPGSGPRGVPRRAGFGTRFEGRSWPARGPALGGCHGSRSGNLPGLRWSFRARAGEPGTRAVRAG